MKNNSRIIFMIIPHIFLYFLCTIKLSSANYCGTISCEKKNSSTFITEISFKSPFRLVNQQPNTCGFPGFDAYCDDKLGPLLELPNVGNFSIDTLYYYRNHIVLSDPNGCLPQMLLSLNYTSISPFIPQTQNSKDFWMYNCSDNGDGDFSFGIYDKIDCLSGLNYSVISVSPGIYVAGSNCTLLKVVSIPQLYSVYGFELSDYTSIDLTWDDKYCVSCATNKRNSPAIQIYWVGITAAVVVSIVFIVICVSRKSRSQSSRRNVEAPIIITTTNTITNQGVSQRQSSTPSNSVQGGLDQVTINSYPTVLIGKSGRLIKPDNDNCSICLADYFPGDTLKILPECLHRFHVGCIDLWLSAEPTCPICRTFPPRNN